MNDIKQLPINFSFYEIKSFFNYIPGNNIFIIETLRRVANENSHNLIFLVGATSSGKTHLCSSTYEESKRNKLYYTAENIHKLKRENIEDLELLILDDFHIIINNHDLEDMLFYIINDLIIRKKSIFLTSSIPVNEINFKLKDLKTRVCSDQILEIKELDDSEKINLLHKIAKNRGWILPDKVSKFILNHFDRDLYFLCNVIKSIDERSLSEKKNITIPFIKKIIKSR